MTFPAKPKTLYDYVTFQTNNPTDPLPANQVAGDFASHKTSIDALNSFRFSATPGGAAINTTGSQSGTHTGTPFYVPRAGIVSAILETWGGAGGGGGAVAAATGGQTAGGGGGGAGGYSRKVVTASDIGAGKLVT
jgi:hypothetical protein